MPDKCHTMGIVLRVRRDKDVLLTVLTPEMGKISVIAKGARSLKGPQMALSQMFCYGDFELYRRGELYWLNTGELKENFYGLSSRLDALNLAVYLCEVAAAASEEDVPGEELMRLLLNALYFLERKTYPDALIKAVFEWRVLRMQGMAPAVSACHGCGCTADADFALDVAGGEILCGKCRRARAALAEDAGLSGEMPNREWVLLTPGALEAIRFSVGTPVERMMSFRLDDTEDRRVFSRAGEKFLRYHLDLDSTALKMYYQMCENQ